MHQHLLPERQDAIVTTELSLAALSEPIIPEYMMAITQLTRARPGLLAITVLRCLCEGYKQMLSLYQDRTPRDLEQIEQDLFAALRASGDFVERWTQALGKDHLDLITVGPIMSFVVAKVIGSCFEYNEFEPGGMSSERSLGGWVMCTSEDLAYMMVMISIEIGFIDKPIGCVIFPKSDENQTFAFLEKLAVSNLPRSGTISVLPDAPPLSHLSALEETQVLHNVVRSMWDVMLKDTLGGMFTFSPNLPIDNRDGPGTYMRVGAGPDNNGIHALVMSLMGFDQKITAVEFKRFYDEEAPPEDEEILLKKHTDFDMRAVSIFLAYTMVQDNKWIAVDELTILCLAYCYGACRFCVGEDKGLEITGDDVDDIWFGSDEKAKLRFSRKVGIFMQTSGFAGCVEALGAEELPLQKEGGSYANFIRASLSGSSSEKGMYVDADLAALGLELDIANSSDVVVRRKRSFEWLPAMWTLEHLEADDLSMIRERTAKFKYGWDYGPGARVEGTPEQGGPG